nr:hypothetical protein Iba_chr01cCG1710 [Ipomoea batatas]
MDFFQKLQSCKSLTMHTITVVEQILPLLAANGATPPNRLNLSSPPTPPDRSSHSLPVSSARRQHRTDYLQMTEEVEKENRCRTDPTSSRRRTDPASPRRQHRRTDPQR